MSAGDEAGHQDNHPRHRDVPEKHNKRSAKLIDPKGKHASKHSKGSNKSDESSKSSSHLNQHLHRRSGRRNRSKKSFFKKKSVLFIVGSLISLCFAHYMAKHDATVDFAEASQEWLSNHQNLSPYTLVELLQQSKEPNRDAKLSDDFAVGLSMYDEGFRPRHPVIMIPGVISSSLENWGLHGTDECPSKPHYRKQMWGGFYMVKQMLLSKHCWSQHSLLDKETGLDPKHFKVRVAQGIESADYFITGYWIWNKIIENSSAMGYDQNNMELASYDWRLGYPDLERRDAYFSNLKVKCESNLKSTGQKTSLVAHSMGSQVAFYFFKWVEAIGPGYGNGGPTWVNDHIAHFVDISGSLLGTPKASVALLSGEMRDTVTLNQLGVQALEKFFSRDVRAEMLRTWPGIASMLPKGGDVIWGDMQHAPDDPANATETFGNFIRFVASETPISAHNSTSQESIDFLFKESPDWFTDKIQNMYSFGSARTRKEVVANEKDPSKWSNPLEVALPNAPDMEIYSLYGVGKDTERAYYYRDSTNDPSTPSNAVIDYDSLEKGSVITGPGDGTISSPCHSINHLWKKKTCKFNPGGVKVKVVEMLHQPDTFDLRGGTQTADHVDILGRTELNEMSLRIVSGRGDEIDDRVVSNINDWVWNLDVGSD